MTETLLQELLDRGFLFDDPATYRAGVVDAWAAIRETAGDTGAGDRTAAA